MHRSIFKPKRTSEVTVDEALLSKVLTALSTIDKDGRVDINNKYLNIHTLHLDSIKMIEFQLALQAETQIDISLNYQLLEAYPTPVALANYLATIQTQKNKKISNKMEAGILGRTLASVKFSIMKILSGNRKLISKMHDINCEDPIGYYRQAINLNYEITPGGELPDLTDKNVLIICNHPSGINDGIIIYDLINQHFADVYAITEMKFMGIVKQKENFLPVDNTRNSNTNTQTVNTACRLLHEGGKVILFPAGKVGQYDFANKQFLDRKWKASLAYLRRECTLYILPIHIEVDMPVWWKYISMLPYNLASIFLLKLSIACAKKPYKVEIKQLITPDNDISEEMLYDLCNK